MRIRSIFAGESAAIIDRAIGYAKDHAEGANVPDRRYAVLPCLAGAADVMDVASESHRRHAFHDWHVAWAVAYAAHAAASSANGNLSGALLAALSAANKSEVAAEEVAYSLGCRNLEAVAHLRDLRKLKKLVADGEKEFDLSDSGPLGPLHRLD